MKNNKRNIKGAEKQEDRKFRGKNISNTIKKVMTATLSVGLAITACHAVRMYNHWATTSTLDNLNSIILELENNSEKNISNDHSFENFETIIKEYKEAMENKDNSRQKELDDIVEEKNYFGAMQRELEDSFIRKLGYEPEEIGIVMGRDGFFLAYKEKMKNKVFIASNGTVSDRVKVTDEHGRIVEIPNEMKKVLQDSAYENSRGVLATTKMYNQLLKNIDNQLDNQLEPD